MLRVAWRPNEYEAVASIEELDRLLDRLATEYAGDKAILVDLEAENGDTLSIGLGRPLSVLCLTPGSGEPPYSVTLGEEAEGKSLVFRCMGEWSQYPMSFAIPTALARKAVRQFFLTGVRPDIVQWYEK